MNWRPNRDEQDSNQNENIIKNLNSRITIEELDMQPGRQDRNTRSEQNKENRMKRNKG